MYKVTQCVVLGILFEVAYLLNDPCTDSVYMQIPYTAKLLIPYMNVYNQVKSAYKCLEFCRNSATCKSVGIATKTMKCYLYSGRTFAGIVGTTKSDMIYYWLLERKCPFDLGYNEDPSTKLCTKYVSLTATWIEAGNHCATERGMLFMLENHNSAKVMAEYANTGVLQQLTYLGATDIYQEGVWEWFNGVPVNRSLFIAGHPNDDQPTNNQDCLVYNSTGDGLVDNDCNMPLAYICQVPTQQAYSLSQR